MGALIRRLSKSVSEVSSQKPSSHSDLPGLGQRVSILGVPLGFGQSMAGVDLGPSEFRVRWLCILSSKFGYRVLDLDDLEIERPRSRPKPGDKLKYLAEIHDACERLAAAVERIVEADVLPITIGGDHSIAIGSIAGVVKSFRRRKEDLGLIYFDAHADMNTTETTPSGNIHGMPLAALLGYGAPELVNVGGFAPKLDPKMCAHVGWGDLDPGERELIRKFAMRVFTMREIDERGLNVCMDEAIAIARQGSAGYCVTFDVDARE